MGDVVSFANSRPVVRRRMLDRYHRLSRLHDAFWLTGDSLHERADQICADAGLPFNVYRLPEGAPPIVHRLVARGHRYQRVATSYYNRAKVLADELWPANSGSMWRA